MKVILDIQDKKADFVIELLNNLSFLKIKQITQKKTELIVEIKEAVDNLNLVKKGKMKAKPLNDLLDELQHSYH